jgi:hypothetical protein
MSLSPLDDFPVHQVAEPIRRVGPSDRHFYDRYYFNCHALDEPLCLIAGFACYPNLGTVDGFVVVVHEGTHRVVRASRELGVDRLDTTVGPMQVEVLEGLKRLRVALEPNDWDLNLDLTFTGAIPAQEEPRHLWRQNHRVVFDTTRLAQTGRWAGSLQVGDRTFEVTPEGWWGCRDRSWGVRPVGEPEPPGIRATRPPSMFWNYAQAQFEDFSILYMVQEDRVGTRILEEAVRVWNDPERPVDHLGRPEHELEFEPGTRTVRAATLHLGAGNESASANGGPLRVRVEPGLAVYLGIGTGYGRDPDWVHGMYQGELKVEGLTVDLDDPANASRKAGVVDTVGQFELDDGEVGHGLWEYSVNGPHDRYGFESYTDGWRAR